MRLVLPVLLCALVLVGTEVHAGALSVNDACAEHAPHSLLACDQFAAAPMVAPAFPVGVRPTDQGLPLLTDEAIMLTAVPLRWNQRERSPPR